MIKYLCADKIDWAASGQRRACVTHQYSSGGGLAGDELAGPVLRLGHEGALELLFALPRRLLLLLLGVVGRELRLLAAADERASAPYHHHEQPREESEDRRQEKAPPFSDTEAVIFRDRGRRLFLGRSHSPKARGIQSGAPCTCNVRALARRRRARLSRGAAPRAVDAARSIRARAKRATLPTPTAHRAQIFSSLLYFCVPEPDLPVDQVLLGSRRFIIQFDDCGGPRCLCCSHNNTRALRHYSTIFLLISNHGELQELNLIMEL